MGIKGLHKLLTELSVKKPIGDYKGSRIAIDAEIFLYKYKCSNKGHYIYPLLNTLVTFLKNDVIPIYVFDGPCHKNKNKVLDKRRKLKEKKYLKIDKLKENLSLMYESGSSGTDLSNMIDTILGHQNSMVNQKYRTEFKSILESLGIPVIIATGEAEIYCTDMVHQGHADYVYTEDSDAIVHACTRSLSGPRSGAIKVLKGLSRATDQRGYHFTEINTLSVLDSLFPNDPLKVQKFIDLCILNGSDYCQSPKTGSVKSMTVINKHGTIEKYLEARIADRDPGGILPRSGAPCGSGSPTGALEISEIIDQVNLARSMFYPTETITDTQTIKDAQTSIQNIDYNAINEYARNNFMYVSIFNGYIREHSKKYFESITFRAPERGS
jgi:5'-3' exonuclease